MITSGFDQSFNKSLQEDIEPVISANKKNASSTTFCFKSLMYTLSKFPSDRKDLTSHIVW